MFVGGCSAKKIVSQWSNPDYRAGAFRRVLVIAATDQTSIRRNFEDQLTSALRATGIDAVPSYRYLPEDGKVARSRLTDAVRRANADGVIISKLLRVEQRAEVTPGYYEPWPAFGMYGWYSRAWYGSYMPPRIYDYPVYFSETRLFDPVKKEVIWSGTLRTVDPESIQDAIGNYVETVVAALKEQNLLRG